jgi:anion-transporting  ArsA/GET3 family ATPase
VVGVAVPEPVVQAETVRLIRQIREQGPPLAALVMNRVTPEPTRSDAEAAVLNACRAELETASATPPMPQVMESGALGRTDRLQQLGQTLWAPPKST